ncbi:MAG: hypothetical protein ACOYWZ_10460, partial [Bacillota bacterium]
MNIMPWLVKDIINLLILALAALLFICLTKEYAKKEKELEHQKLYNKSLRDILNQLGEFKHNFDNIMATITGYAEFGRLDDLLNYLNETGTRHTSLGLINMSMIKRIKDPGIMG